MIKVTTNFNKGAVIKAALEEGSQQMKSTGNRIRDDLFNATPKDTGAAASDWTVVQVGPKGEFDLQNTKDYVKYLNRGTSQQAPAMFIESKVLAYGTPSGPVVEYDDNTQ